MQLRRSGRPQATIMVRASTEIMWRQCQQGVRLGIALIIAACWQATGSPRAPVDVVRQDARRESNPREDYVKTPRQYPIGKMRRVAVAAAPSQPRVWARGAATEFIAKWMTILGVVGAAAWGLFRWSEGGGRDWMVNLQMSADVLPYDADTRLVAVHLRAVNPLDRKFEFDRPADRYAIDVYAVPDHARNGSTIAGEKGKKLASADLLPDDGYLFLPHAEFDDTAIFVLPAGKSVFIEATVADAHDEVQIDKVMLVGP